MSLPQAFELLAAHFGPQRWWPGDTPFEVVVGAILTQNTNWTNVERALQQLREASLLELEAVEALPVAELAELIRPAGYYRLKAQRLKNFVGCVTTQFEGSLERLFEQSLDDLRESLLSINGIGPETADSIMLYAAKKPIFVVDTYTSRVLKRHGWIDFEADYFAIQGYFHDQLPADTGLFNEYHALLVKVGKEHCGPRPRCEGCPLAPLLPHGQPLAPPWE